MHIVPNDDSKLRPVDETLEMLRKG